ncbi:AAA family ATPase [uncultured Sunxiuqinia sp.]|uniref:AAA family ATPase n=1 Tax=uncultured Sunxiuqinia sp. TaxID=1573825 RepID=UPI002AA65C65|nr:AAA family ATPase [uncultured Sunxiuqinia sp.]
MGNLIIKQVRYYGEQYYFESPEFDEGVNIIVGDNGSGKSTFSYFIEYGLGGTVKPFNDNEKREKYSKILDDKNNFVEIDIQINAVEYSIKRFINQNEIFISDGETVNKFPINRHKEHAPFIFSDWLLKKLSIPVFELNLGVNTWYFNFSDLYRLLCYDQDTEPRRIFKSPPADNFIADSSIIRKSTFEIMLGISSIEYYKKLDELKKFQKLKDASKSRLTDFIEMYPRVSDDRDELEDKIDEFNRQLEKLIAERDLYQKTNTKVDEKTEHLAQIQSDLINLDLKVSEDTVQMETYQSEVSKIRKLHTNLTEEISEIKKTIFTHEKLNLFSMEVCPFCMTKKPKKEGFCICGEEFSKDKYEKFVYSASEYTEILKHKEKSLATIQVALTSYDEEIKKLRYSIDKNTSYSNDLKQKLRSVINAIEYSGNSQFVDSLNEKINEVKKEILENENELELTKRKRQLNNDFESKNRDYKKVNQEFNQLKFRFEKGNEKTIKEFNIIYNELMQKSSCNCNSAQIDEEYMPFIDEGEYKNKSADVPKRMMYYYTILSLSLKLKSVKHPGFLLLDTPETAGIDDDNLKHDLELLELALKLSKNKESDELGKFQILLTTGEEKYPEHYKDKIKLRFSEKNKDFILKERNTADNKL